MMRQTSSTPFTFFVIITSIAVAVLLRLAMNPFIGEGRIPFATFYAAVAFVAWFGGWRPAAVAVFLSSLAAEYFFMPPLYHLNTGDTDNLISLVLYIFVSGVVILFAEVSRQYGQQADLNLTNLQTEMKERERVQAALQESEQFVRNVLDGISTSIAILDQHGEIIAMNKTWQEGAAKVPNLHAIAQVGTNYLNFLINQQNLSGQILPFVQGMMGVLAGEIELFEIEYGFPKENEKTWYIARVTRLANSKRIIVAQQDITQRKLIEKEVQQQAQIIETANRVGQILATKLKLEELIQNVTDAAVDLSRAQYGAFFYNVVNPEDEAYTLYTLSGTDKANFEAFPMPHKTEILAPTFYGEGIVRSGNIQADPRFGKNAPYFGMPLGHLPVVSYLAVPVISRSGKVLGGLFLAHSEPNQFSEYEEYLLKGVAAQAAIAMDNAQLYAELDSERQRLHVTLASIGEGVIATNTSERVSFMNPMAEQLTGWTREDALGKPIGEVLVLKNNDIASPLLISSSIEQKIHFTPTFVLVTRDQREIPIVLTPTSIKRTDGEVFGSVLIFRDITTQKQTEDQLKNLALKLSQSNRELESFAYIASHDLQEPLRKVRIFGDRLKTKYANVLDETGVDYIARMQRAAERMNNLIENLLSFSRVAGRGQVLSEVNLNGVVEQVINDLETLIEETATQIDCMGLPTLEADSAQMTRLFQNLITNSIKYRRSDVPPRITIQAHLYKEVWQTSSQCEIRITDNGIGFDNQQAERIFGLFQRLHGVAQFEGTGIGLSICRRIVERHNGSIRAVGRPNEGAMFIITLPTKQPVQS